MFAGDLGIDIWEAIDAASTKPFGYMRFTPGPGRRRPLPPHRPELPLVAGEELARSELPLRRARQRRQRAHARLRRAAAPGGAQRAQRKAVNGSRILLLGLAYKKNTSDARESPAIDVARRLVAMGAEVQRRRSPRARADRRSTSSSSTSRQKELVESDAVVLLSDHDAFDLEMVEQHAPFILDTRARLQRCPGRAALSARRLTTRRTQSTHDPVLRGDRHSMTQTYLITGGAGFIGSHLRSASSSAVISVVVLDDLSTGRLENLVGFRDHPRLQPRDRFGARRAQGRRAGAPRATSSCTSRPRSG